MYKCMNVCLYLANDVLFRWPPSCPDRLGEEAIPESVMVDVAQAVRISSSDAFDDEASTTAVIRTSCLVGRPSFISKKTWLSVVDAATFTK